MKRFKFTQKAIDIFQWVIILVLVSILAIQGGYYSQMKEDLVFSTEYNKENTYIRIHESQRLDKLKRENKELRDSIKKIQQYGTGKITSQLW